MESKIELILAYRNVDNRVEEDNRFRPTQDPAEQKRGTSMIDKPVLSKVCPYPMISLKILDTQINQKMCFHI